MYFLLWILKGRKGGFYFGYHQGWAVGDMLQVEEERSRSLNYYFLLEMISNYPATMIMTILSENLGYL